MSLPSSSASRPLTCLKQALRQCRAERQQRRHYAEWLQPSPSPLYPSLHLIPKYRKPSSKFRTSHAIKQNRPDNAANKIPVVPPPRSITKICPDPLQQVFLDQLPVLDPTGARTRLFSPANVDRAKVGDIIMVRLKSGDPFSGVLISIRQRHSPVDAAILLRGQLTRVGVEMWFKIYSPNVEGMEIVQRKPGKRARRARLYYMRNPKHDRGSVENIVKQYLKTRSSTTSRDRTANKKTAAAEKETKKGK